MAERRKHSSRSFTLENVRHVCVEDLVTVAVGTEQSLRMIIDDEKGEPCFVLLLLNMADYEKWGNLLSVLRKP